MKKILLNNENITRYAKTHPRLRTISLNKMDVALTINSDDNRVVHTVILANAITCIAKVNKFDNNISDEELLDIVKNTHIFAYVKKVIINYIDTDTIVDIDL